MPSCIKELCAAAFALSRYPSFGLLVGLSNRPRAGRVKKNSVNIGDYPRFCVNLEEVAEYIQDKRRVTYDEKKPHT